MRTMISGAICGALVAGGIVFVLSSIETNCKRLGVFTIGDRVYECKLKEKNNG
jgi:hypothetical protein